MGISLKNRLYERLSKSELDAIEAAGRAAEKNGFKIYLVGGIVRDLIMQNPLKDIDIIVEGDAIEFANLLSQNGICEISDFRENLRTAKTVFKDGVETDFASTRDERYTGSGILPVAYNFGCKIENDVKRRDFTINTLYLSLTGDNKYEIIDFYGGEKDIQAGIIKILHDKSFIDDPSRIIRALKFKERFSFDFDKNTGELMQKYLANPSTDMPLERIKNELRQYFEIGKPGLYENLLKSNAYKLVSDNPVFDYDKDEAEKLPFEKRFFVYLALLTLNSSYDNSRMNFTSHEKKSISEVKNLLEKNLKELGGKEIYDAFITCEKEAVMLYKVIKNDAAVNLFIEKLQNIKVEITGSDLIEKGFKPSKLFGEAFDKIIEAKINGKIKTKDEELLFAENFLKENNNKDL